ncbi:hypothetical protein CHARACLAT_007031, partial [Characodon lateralis]|nr:hypothetical protein [Characodon lateralis]
VSLEIFGYFPPFLSYNNTDAFVRSCDPRILVTEVRLHQERGLHQCHESGFPPTFFRRQRGWGGPGTGSVEDFFQLGGIGPSEEAQATEAGSYLSKEKSM